MLSAFTMIVVMDIALMVVIVVMDNDWLCAFGDIFVFMLMLNVCRIGITVVLVMMVVAIIMVVMVMMVVAVMMVVMVMMVVAVMMVVMVVMVTVVALDFSLAAGAATSGTHRNSLLQNYSTSICFTCKLPPLSTCRAWLPQCGHPASCRSISTLALHSQHQAVAGK
ncbi:hydrogenase nickel incorporation protein hybF [Yersinia bercovieri ATCC 43970]|uniref:Hydrogenase nickel incorporation protein hybF n=1 Tax=Yersinia bercovieri ATCC 43970 TaxID=349968 RepID=A0ABP2E3I8_YERBE|nr:hydrogenase nickel incorporation protein hybF [Yersinia bercovieri ATCC 43970]